MLADIFKNRLFIGALVFFIFCVVGGTLYIGYVEQQGAKELAEAEERIKQLTEKQNEQATAKAPVGGPSQGGHRHGDEWHADPHEPVEQQPTAEVGEPEPPPAYIYDPDAKERPDGWDPKLVYDTGHGKVIDLNYRPLDEEEQAEYEHLKATLVPPEDYGVTEAGLIITAIGNIQRKNAPAFMKSLEVDMLAGKSREYRLERLREFHDIFAD